MIMFRASHISLFLFLCLPFGITFGQAYLIDNPYIINHSKTAYKGGIENWDVITTSKGFVYFANNEGLLKFNGSDWSLYKLPNKTIVLCFFAFLETGLSSTKIAPHSFSLTYHMVWVFS